MKTPNLIFITPPALTHLIPTVEAAKLLLHRDGRLSVTFLVLPNSAPFATAASHVNTTSSTPTLSSRLTFINLPHLRHSDANFCEQFDVHIDSVRLAISDLTKNPTSQIAGVVLDIFVANFAHVAGEFNLPAYLYFTGGAASLGVFQHLASLKSEGNEELERCINGEVELHVPCYSLPLPGKVLPAALVDENLSPAIFLDRIKRVWGMKGVMINTFYELELYAIQSLISDDKMPEIYPVGPVLNREVKDCDDEVKRWLDEQPENSVVFVCFGTTGGFDETQVREIANGLERSGSRFLWSLRKPGMQEYEDFNDVLPEGFLERNKGVGKVIGWAAQVAVLAHAAVGGFLSHCGWNSTLESVWLGVPVAGFPLFAEQHLNAFYLAEEMKMAEVVTLDYQMDFTGKKPPVVVGLEEIASAVRRLMAEEGGGVRERVKEMMRKTREALVEDGSSYVAQTLFIEDVLKNVALY